VHRALDYHSLNTVHTYTYIKLQLNIDLRIKVNMPLEYTTTRTGHPMLIYEGFTFRKDRDADDLKRIWRCSDSECKGRCHTRLDTVTWHSDNHNHAPSHARIDKLKFIEKLKDNAMSSSSRSPAEILASASKENTLELNANLPRADSLKKVISRVRNKTGKLSKITEIEARKNS
jgi:hypothetical protein